VRERTRAEGETRCERLSCRSFITSRCSWLRSVSSFLSARNFKTQGRKDLSFPHVSSPSHLAHPTRLLSLPCRGRSEEEGPTGSETGPAGGGKRCVWSRSRSDKLPSLAFASCFLPGNISPRSLGIQTIAHGHTAHQYAAWGLRW